MRPGNYQIRSNNANWRAFLPFKVIQGHQFWYQSKAHIRLPIKTIARQVVRIKSWIYDSATELSPCSYRIFIPWASRGRLLLNQKSNLKHIYIAPYVATSQANQEATVASPGFGARRDTCKSYWVLQEATRARITAGDFPSTGHSCPRHSCGQRHPSRGYYYPRLRRVFETVSDDGKSYWVGLHSAKVHVS